MSILIVRHSATNLCLREKTSLWLHLCHVFMDTGPVETYSKMIIDVEVNDQVSRDKLVKDFINMQYKKEIIYLLIEET